MLPSYLGFVWFPLSAAIAALVNTALVWAAMQWTSSDRMAALPLILWFLTVACWLSADRAPTSVLQRHRQCDSVDGVRWVAASMAALTPLAGISTARPPKPCTANVVPSGMVARSRL